MGYKKGDSSMQELLTVEEVALKARTTTTTVYRWLKTGRLKGMKIGKEWRIPASELDMDESVGKSTPSYTRPNTMNRRCDNQGDIPCFWESDFESAHILGLCPTRNEVYEMEASFINAAASKDQQILKGCWWQDPAELAERFSDAGADFDGMRKDGLLRVVDFNEAYQEYGPIGPVHIWQHAIAARGTATLWVCGAPAPVCFGTQSITNLLTFENELDKAIEEAPVIGLCTYSYEDIEFGGYELLLKLMALHSIFTFYEKDIHMAESMCYARFQHKT